jgi:hypothetical protein
MTSEKIQPWKAHWVPCRQIDDIVEYGAEKGTEIIMDGGGGGAVVDETEDNPEPADRANSYQRDPACRVIKTKDNSLLGSAASQKPGNLI